MIFLPVDAAEFGREFFGVLLRDVSGVFPRSVALRAITCICSLERAILLLRVAAGPLLEVRTALRAAAGPVLEVPAAPQRRRRRRGLFFACGAARWPRRTLPKLVEARRPFGLR